MSKDINLKQAQGIFRTLMSGKLDSFSVPTAIENMQRMLERAQEDGQPSLGIEKLDSTGKMRADEVESAIVHAKKAAQLERGISAARYTLDNMPKSSVADGRALPQHIADTLERTLKGAGADTSLFEKDNPPTPKEVGDMLKTYEQGIKDAKSAMQRTSGSRSR